MDRITLSSLVGNIVVIGLDGNIRTLAEGESPKPGELIIEEVSDTSELVVEQVTPQGSSINVTDDITSLIEAIAQGQDPTQLGEDFETAAGGLNGSSPQTTGAINRTGAESLASTNFETVGINGTGFSSTQVQTLFDIFQPQTPEPSVIPIPAEVVVQEISSPTVNEGDQVTFEVTLDQATEIETNIELSLDDGSAIGGPSGAEGVDYVNTTVLVTLSDGTTQEIQVNEDGTFSVSLPIGVQSFTVSLDSVADDIYEGPETFTLTGATPEQETPVSGTATVLDDGTGPGPNPDDDRPEVASISSVSVNEGDPATFEVTLSNTSTTATSVSMSLAEDDDPNTVNAERGVDYEATSVTVRYANGEEEPVEVKEDGSFTINVPAEDLTFEILVDTTPDDVFEGPEMFALSGSTATQEEPAVGIGTILDDGTGPGTDPDDDRPRVISISSVEVNEGESAPLVVTLSNASTTETVVNMTLSDVSAEGGAEDTADYTNTFVTIDFGNGEAPKDVAVNSDGSFEVTVPAVEPGEELIAPTFTVKVQTTSDDVYEGPETFELRGSTAAQQEENESAFGIGTILDDGTGPGTDPDDDRPRVISISSVEVNEGESAPLVVTLSNASTTETVVNMTLSDVSAEGGAEDTADYTNTFVTIDFGNGEAPKDVAVNSDGSFEVTVPAVEPGEELIAPTFTVKVQTTSDDVYEGPETFELRGSTAAQQEENESAFGIGTILDDEDRPTVSIEGGGEVDEGGIAEFTVKLDMAADTEVTTKLQFNHVDTVNDDFDGYQYQDKYGEWKDVPTSGSITLTFEVGQTEINLRVLTKQDDVYEEDETFSIEVLKTSTTVVDLDNNVASATILDDDNTPPTARDFSILLDVEEGIFPEHDVEFDGTTSAGLQRVEDLEDDIDGANDADIKIQITELPEHGELYYEDGGQEVIIDETTQFAENTDVKYRLTDDFFENQSFDSTDVEDRKGFEADSIQINGLSFYGGQIGTATDINGDPTFDSTNFLLRIDGASQQEGLIVVSPGEEGQGDEIATGEFIALELDEGLEAKEVKLNLASLNNSFNSNGTGIITAYLFLDGALVDTQDFNTSQIEYLSGSQHEGSITVTWDSGFDEVRLTPENEGGGDKASFTLVGTEFTSFKEVNDDFTYQAIDTDGAVSNEATVSVNFDNVTSDSVSTADYNTQSLTLTSAADAEANIIMGDDGDNELVGTSGDDILIGGLGNDILTGGEGDDVFKWTEMKSATDTVTDFESGDQLDFADLFEDVSQSDISLLLDDLGSGDFSGQVEDISITVTERGQDSTLMIHKGGMDLEVNFDGASAADIANSLISNLEQLRE
ncbi:Calx-beta domain-containing protein [Vibrio sp. EA2]|uniref:Calx-beta domain-containing protein n=1 Tax=Vibrio sp. EA2 TaxID=3079860 RepID=UPI00294A2F93|nr:Calx-beta domain-containing protein [Vibrio sp. EA2]MDV6251127.1 Calx-beta domain-containing protein [Vibrio sp. EA2]